MVSTSIVVAEHQSEETAIRLEKPLVVVLVYLGSMLLGTHARFHLDSAPAQTVLLILTAVLVLACVRRQVVTRRVGES